MAESAIEWTEMTWDPSTGCDRVSPGCDNCYAMTLAKRLKAMGQPKYQLDGDPRTSGPGFGLTVHEDALQVPHSWTSPRVVFVNSMATSSTRTSRLASSANVFEVMAETPRHTYQVLTKRPKRLARVADSLAVAVEPLDGCLHRDPALRLPFRSPSRCRRSCPLHLCRAASRPHRLSIYRASTGSSQVANPDRGRGRWTRRGQLPFVTNASKPTLRFSSSSGAAARRRPAGETSTENSGTSSP